MATRKPIKGTSAKKTTPIVKKSGSAPTQLKKSPEKKTTSKATASTNTSTIKPVEKKITAKQPVQKSTTSGKRTSSQRTYVRLSGNADSSKFREMGEKLKNGKVKWAFYAIDGDIGYHYYEVL
jgi:hypothetical protein